MTGKVLWFDVKKGYGFIRSGSQDIFVHFSKIHAPMGEFRVLEQGEWVEFEVFHADRGNGDQKPQAKNVTRLEGVKHESLREHAANDQRGHDDSTEKDQAL